MILIELNLQNMNNKVSQLYMLTKQSDNTKKVKQETKYKGRPCGGIHVWFLRGCHAT